MSYSPLWLRCAHAMMFALAMSGSAVAEEPLVPYQVRGDTIMTPLSEKQGDPLRGRALALNRAEGGCVLCHGFPGVNEQFAGDLGPSLAGVGERLSEGQLRLRIVDPSRVNSVTIMPAYYRVKGLQQVAQPFRNRPILTAEDIEDIVAYLVTLKEP